MDFMTRLNTALDEIHLLKHPFYQAWNAGTLPKAILQNYSTEYYHHVAAFPRYISQIHTNCRDIESRQILLGNLIEEEQGPENHPELWLRFVEGLGQSRSAVQTEPEFPKTQALVEGYFDLVKKDYATGLGALYAYERQTPEVAHSKIEGLEAHYDIHDEKTLSFFSVHEKADEWHREELVGLIEKMSEEQQQQVFNGAIEGAQLLWGFLDGMYEKCMH